MTETPGTILWDFDGTLVRSVFMWSRACLRVLDDQEPGHGLTLEEVRTGLQADFPWHHPDVPHPELNDPSAWWRHMEDIFAGAFAGLGYRAGRAAELAGHVRAWIVDPAAYELFDETLAVLSDLRSCGWRHAIVSNHVPELPEIVAALPLGKFIDAVHTSALIGYEKPNPEIFRAAMRAAADRGHAVRWMIGDQPVADLEGGRAVGLDVLIVRNPLFAASDAHELSDVPRLVGEAR